MEVTNNEKELIIVLSLRLAFEVVKYSLLRFYWSRLPLKLEDAMPSHHGPRAWRSAWGGYHTTGRPLWFPKFYSKSRKIHNWLAWFPQHRENQIHSSADSGDFPYYSKKKTYSKCVGHVFPGTSVLPVTSLAQVIKGWCGGSEYHSCS